MKKYLIIIFVFQFCAITSHSQIINKIPLSKRQTGYTIDAKLDTLTKTVAGRMKAFWVNMSSDIVPDIQLHLYMNAFRDSRSTMNREMNWTMSSTNTDTGQIDIDSFTDRSGNDLIPLMKYISPDDGNQDDRTVLKVQLPKPALPGDTVFISMTFKTRLPKLRRRAGYASDFYFVAQWFPKFGVYESAGMRYALKGAWNCHQFHANSEFYSNHSLYNVNITLPRRYVVGTGGVLMSENDSLPDGKYKSLKYRAEDIVDFAWTAWPGYLVFTDQWNDVKLTLLLPADRTEQVKRQFTAVKHALEYFTENVGPYPWPYVTIVDPPSKGAPAGGMEYTTMFTTSSSFMMPVSFHLPEMVTIHEFGHAYFMGIMASNEFEEPWLDEGVNTFFEDRIMDHYYGKESSLIDNPLLKISDKSLGRLSYVHSSGRQLVSNNEYSWNYPHGTYGMMSYNKTATWLYTMMGILGEETTNEVFRDYYKKWAFKYPSGADFVNVVNEVVAKIAPDSSMNWFFKETLYGTGLCDYKVADIINKKIYIKPEQDTVSNSGQKDLSKKDQLFKSIAQLERDGDIMLPVEVLVHFNNGEQVLESWDGKSRYKDFVYRGRREIDWVKIDPDFKIRMDVNYVNNSMSLAPDRLPVRRISDKVIAFMQFLINFILL